MRVSVPKGRVIVGLRGTGVRAPADLVEIVKKTGLSVYDGREALLDSGLTRLDEGRRRRGVR
jgi:hypothetical protein